MVRTYSRWRICATLAFCCMVLLSQAAWSKEPQPGPNKKDPAPSSGNDSMEPRGSIGTPSTSPNDALWDKRFGIYVLEDGQPSKNQWSVKIFKGPCRERREVATEFQIKGIKYIQLAQSAGSAQELCAAISPDKLEVSPPKCFAVPIRAPFWTPQIDSEAKCPPQGENVAVNFEVKGSPNRVSFEELKKAVDGLTVTIRSAAVTGPTVFLDLSGGAAPVTKTDVRISPPDDYYTVTKVVTDNKQIDIFLDQKFVNLTDLKLEPRTSSGALATGCVLTLFVESRAMLRRAEWNEALSLPEFAQNGEIRIYFVNGQYVLPQLADGRRLQFSWPRDTPSPVKIRSAADNADCNMRDAATVDRTAFFGGAYAPVVRQSRPGLALVATRLDSHDLEKLGLAFDTETQFWISLFSMVDTIDRSDDSRSSLLEWARISQYQSGADSDHEFEFLMPPGRGARLFGGPNERQSKIITFVSRLTATRPREAQKFAPFDAFNHLAETLVKMAASSGGGVGQPVSNVRVLVAGPRLGDAPICGRLRTQESTNLAESLAQKARNIRLSFVEVSPDENPQGLSPTAVRGLSQCDLSGSKLAGVAASYVVSANYLSSEQTRKQVFDELGKLIARDFNLGG